MTVIENVQLMTKTNRNTTKYTEYISRDSGIMDRVLENYAQYFLSIMHTVFAIVHAIYPVFHYMLVILELTEDYFNVK